LQAHLQHSRPHLPVGDDSLYLLRVEVRQPQCADLPLGHLALERLPRLEVVDVGVEHLLTLFGEELSALLVAVGPMDEHEVDVGETELLKCLFHRATSQVVGVEGVPHFAGYEDVFSLSMNLLLELAG